MPANGFSREFFAAETGSYKLSVDLISIYKTTGYFLFDERSPVVQTPRCRAANWVFKDQDRRMG